MSRIFTSWLAREASVIAVQQAGVTPEQIAFIVVGTTTPDTIFPSTACMLQAKIGATNAWGFDLGAACSGFTYALTTGMQMVASGAHDLAAAGGDIGCRVIIAPFTHSDRQATPGLQSTCGGRFSRIMITASHLPWASSSGRVALVPD